MSSSRIRRSIIYPNGQSSLDPTGYAPGEVTVAGPRGVEKAGHISQGVKCIGDAPPEHYNTDAEAPTGFPPYCLGEQA